MPADEDDAGGEGVGAARPSTALRSHWPSAGDGEASANQSVEESVPATAGSSLIVIALGLLEGVIDGDRKGGVNLLGEAVHRLSHTAQEECLCPLLAAMAVRASDQLLGLRHSKRGKEIGEDRLQRTTQPDIEEVRKIGIAYIV